jgi:hypothetical protein
MSSPANEGVPCTPSDTTVFAPTRGLYVGVAGDVTVDYAKVGTNVLIKAAPVGYHPISITRVYATGTAATNILLLN